MRTYKTFNKKNTDITSLTQLATRLLPEQYSKIIIENHSQNPSSELTKSDLETYCHALSTIKVIIKFFKKENITEETASLILEDNEKIEEIKALYKEKNIKARVIKHKDLFSLLKKPEYLVKLSLVFLPRQYIDYIFLKYGNTLDETKGKNLDSGILNKISYSIKLLREILKFLEEENITEDKAKYLLSEEGKKELEELLVKYEKRNNSKNNNFQKIDTKYYKSIFEYFSCSKTTLKFAVLILNEEDRNLLYMKFDEDLENIIPKEKVNVVDNTTIRAKIIPRLQKIVEFLEKENITEKHISYLCSDYGREDLRTLIEMYDASLAAKRYTKVALDKNISKNFPNAKSSELNTLRTLVLIKRYEDKINIGMISEILNIDKSEVFDTYITYKLKK